LRLPRSDDGIAAHECFLDNPDIYPVGAFIGSYGAMIIDISVHDLLPAVGWSLKSFQICTILSMG